MTTRDVVRKAIGRNLGSLYAPPATVFDSTHVDLPLPVNLGVDLAGHRAYYKDQERYVSFDGAVGQQAQLTISPAFSTEGGNALVAGDEVELWAPPWSPTQINGFIDQALIAAARHIYENLSPLYECVTSRNQEFPLPADVAMVQEVYYRHSFYYEIVYVEENWEPIGAVSTPDISKDYTDYRFPPATRIDTLLPVLLQADLTPRNLTGMTHAEGWFKTTSDLGLTMSLREGTNERAEIEYSLEAADDWKYISKELPNPSMLAAIDNVQVVIGGSGTVWLDGLWGLSEPSINWRKTSRDRWRIDRNTRTLAIRPRHLISASGIFSGTSYLDSWLWPIEDVVKIIIGADPPLLTTDTDETEVPGQFIIAYGTHLAYSTVSGGRTTDIRAFRQQAGRWETKAAYEMTRFPFLSNVRRVR